MSRPHLTLEETARGLEYFPGRYHAIDVFASDIQELAAMKTRPGTLPPSVAPLGGSGCRFAFTSSAGGHYRLEIVPDHGVARMTRAGTDSPSSPNTDAAPGAAIGAAIDAAESIKGIHWKTDLVLGLLAGVILAPDQGIDDNRIFALRFDPEERGWQTYDGGLLRWMKRQLHVPPGDV